MFTYEKIKSLNDLEVSIYNYIISNSEKASRMTIRELAAQLHVSSTTILRFCSKMGCEGYSEFKYKLKEYLKDSGKREFADDYTIIQDFFKKVEHSEFDQEIQKAAEIICSREKVFFVGLGDRKSVV